MADIADVEILMHAFRLARTGRYRTAAELLAALKEDFPDVEEARLKDCLKQLAERFMRHG